MKAIDGQAEFRGREHVRHIRNYGGDMPEVLHCCRTNIVSEKIITSHNR